MSCVASRHDDIHLEPNELGCELGKAFLAPLAPAILDRYGVALDPTEFVQSQHEGVGPRAPARLRGRTQKTDRWRLAGLLRVHRERPRDCRSTESGNEPSPSDCHLTRPDEVMPAEILGRLPRHNRQ